MLNWQNLRIIEKMKEGSIHSFLMLPRLNFLFFLGLKSIVPYISSMNGSYTAVSGLQCQPLGYYSSVPVQRQVLGLPLVLK